MSLMRATPGGWLEGADCPRWSLVLGFFVVFSVLSGDVLAEQKRTPPPVSVRGASTPVQRDAKSARQKAKEKRDEQALKKLKEAFLELRALRRALERRERQLKSLEQQLQNKKVRGHRSEHQASPPDARRSVPVGRRSVPDARRSVPDARRSVPVGRRSVLVAPLGKSEEIPNMKALRDAFRRPKPSVRREPVLRRQPALERSIPSKPGSKGELDALRDAFRNAPPSKNAPVVTNPSPVRTFSSQRQGGWIQQLANVMNPALSVLGIFAGGWTTVQGGHCHADGVCHGQVGIFGHTHDPIRTGLNLQQVELALSASVDPFFQATVILSILDREIEIEEAYMSTTSLPWQLQLKIGKFLSESTRLGSKHLHDLDFVTVSMPLVLAVGGEMSHYAAQLTWLAPLPFYLRLGGELSYGGSVAFPIEDPSVPVVVGHMRMFFDLDDSFRLLLGAGVSYGTWDRADATAADLKRLIANGHLLFQWRPPQRGTSMMFKLLVEYFGTWSECDPRKTNSNKPQFRQYCVRTDPQDVAQQALHGITTKAVLRFAQQWQTGVRLDWMQQREPSAQRPTHRLSGMLVFVPTEFSRIRLEYNVSNLFDSNELAHAVWLQFQFSIGAHGAHRF